MTIWQQPTDNQRQQGQQRQQASKPEEQTTTSSQQEQAANRQQPEGVFTFHVGISGNKPVFLFYSNSVLMAIQTHSSAFLSSGNRQKTAINANKPR